MNRVLTYYLKPYYLRMMAGFVIKFAGTIMDLCLPWILAHMIDYVIPHNNKNMIYICSHTPTIIYLFVKLKSSL